MKIRTELLRPPEKNQVRFHLDTQELLIVIGSRGTWEWTVQHSDLQDFTYTADALIEMTLLVGWIGKKPEGLNGEYVHKGRTTFLGEFDNYADVYRSRTTIVRAVMNLDAYSEPEAAAEPAEAPATAPRPSPLPNPLDDPQKRAAYYGATDLDREHPAPTQAQCTACEGTGGAVYNTCPACRGAGLVYAGYRRVRVGPAAAEEPYFYRSAADVANPRQRKSWHG